MSAMPERIIKAYVSKERIEVPHPNPLIATYVYDGEPRAPDEVEGWIVIAPHSEPPVPESALLAAEARVREVEAAAKAAEAERARLIDALGLCGVNSGNVNLVPKWWHVAADESEPIHDTVEEAANAVWAVRETFRAERDALVARFRKYGWHLDDCSAYAMDDGHCTCGFHEAREGG